MRYWLTPFRLPAAACITLTEAGLQPWPEDGTGLPKADSLLLYDSPDQLISMVRPGHEADALTARTMLQDYRSLQGWWELTGLSLFSISQLQLLDPHCLRAFFAGDDAFPPPANPLPIPPLLAAVTLRLLESEPGLLDCYLDLELRAVVLGRDPDLHYHERLRQAGQEAEPLLQAFLSSQRFQVTALELEQRLANRDGELKEARQAGEQSLEQLHQVQEELEHYVLADAEKQRRLEERERELEELRLLKARQESAHAIERQSLRERLESRLAELEHCLAVRDAELQEERDAAELSLQQLHHVQEELELYFLKARASDQLAQAQLEQLQRAQRLMVQLQPDVRPIAPVPPALAVEVVPALPAAMTNPTLQTQALLSTYAACLERASALLERARRV